MSRTYKVYCAGPMTGLTYDEIKGWRDEVIKLISPNIICYSPLRGKNKPDEGVKWDALGRDDKILSSSRAILVRDMWDVDTSDLIFVNLLGANRVSIGTVAEMAWAYKSQKPIVLAMENGNPHDHAFIHAFTPFIVKSLEEGIWVIENILLPNNSNESNNS